MIICASKAAKKAVARRSNAHRTAVGNKLCIYRMHGYGKGEAKNGIRQRIPWFCATARVAPAAAILHNKPRALVPILNCTYPRLRNTGSPQERARFKMMDVEGEDLFRRQAEGCEQMGPFRGRQQGPQRELPQRRLPTSE